jgi:single stranded DNA-binding protein
MGHRDGTDRKVGGMNSWRAGCVETRTSGPEGGLRKRTGRKTGTAPQPDPYAWRSLAENVAESLTKGARVMVYGRLQQRSWETPEGDKRSVVEVQAEEVGPSLRWATAKPERTSAKAAAGASKGGQFNDEPPF